MITDPAFYAVAVAAVVLMGLAKSGFLGGFGSMATPLLALTVPVPQAAAIMLPLLLAMDVTGIQQLWRERERALLALLLPAGLAGTLVGWTLFGLLNEKAIVAVVGALTLAFLAQRLFMPPRRDGAPPSRAAGRVLAVVSGFTSFVAHAGSPPILAYVLPLKLDPLRAAATLAVFFGAVNLSKWIPYALLGLLDARNLLTSLVLLPLAPLGVWAGVWAVKRVNARWFYGLAYAGMAATGAKLLWDGLR